MNELKAMINPVSIVSFLAGIVLSGAGSYMLFDTRLTQVETRISDTHLIEIPQRLATIETLLREREK